MGNFSKEKVMEAQRRQAEEGAKSAKPVRGDDKPLFSFKGMLGAKTGMGAAARRADYVKYADSQIAAGKEVVPYERWAEGKWGD